MLNRDSIAAVDSACFRQCLRRPLYESYCFSNIPGTIEQLLCGSSERRALPRSVLPYARAECVVLILIDAFGWRFLEAWRSQQEALHRLCEEAIVSKLTSQYPSTTSAHVTLLHSGLLPAESGVLEWFHYHPAIDEILCPLLFSPMEEAFDGARDSLRLDPSSVLPSEAFYADLARRGVAAHVLQSSAYAFSVYSRTMLRGAEVHPFGSPQEAFALLGGLLTAGRGPRHYLLYLDGFEAACHQFGPQSGESRSALASLLALLSDFDREHRGTLHDTTFLLTADHGAMEIFPERAVYLDKGAPALERLIARNQRGRPLVPAGASRNMFLHLAPGAAPQAQRILGDLLADRAFVLTRAELDEGGFFGAPLGAHAPHAGDLVILPRAREMVWWSGNGRYESGMLGQHGGLTPEEMDIPLIAWDSRPL